MVGVRLGFSVRLEFMGWVARVGRIGQFSAEERRASALFSKYEQDKDLGALREAVRLYQAALATDGGKAAYAHNLGVGLLELSRHDEDPAIVRQAVAAGRMAVSGTPDGNRNKAMYLSALALSLMSLSKQTDNADRAGILGEAVAMYRGSLGRIPEGDPRRPELHLRIGLAAKSLSELTSDARYLTEAITELRAAAASTPDDDPQRSRRLGVLANALRAQFRDTGDGATLDAAISSYWAALAVVKPEDSTRATLLTLLGGCLRDRFTEAHDLGDLRTEVRVRRLAVRAAPATAPRLSSLAIALTDLFRLTGDTALLEEAVLVSRTAVKATPSSDPGRAARLDRLGVNLRRLADRTGAIDQLREAVAVHREAISTATADDRSLPAYRSNLAGALRVLYTHTGDHATLAEAIAAGREGVAGTAADDSDLGVRLEILGNALLDEFEATGREELLEEAISAQRAALAAIPAEDPKRANTLQALGMALHEDYRRTGRADMLAEAIQAYRDSLDATPATDYRRPSRINGLGTALAKLSQHTGDAEVIAEAIDLTREAIDATPDRDPDKMGYVVNLGNHQHTFFKLTGDQAALIEAQAAFKEAASRIPAGHPLRANAHNGVGFTLLAAFKRGGSEDQLRAAVEAFRTAVDLTPQDHPGRDRRQGNLASALHDVYEKTRDEQALRESVDLHRTVLAHAGPTHPDRALRAHNLSIALRALYGKTDDPHALAEAAEASQLAATTTPADHSDHASRLHSHGGNLIELYRLTGDRTALAEARAVLGEAAAAANAPVAIRIGAGRLQFTADTLASDHPAALAAMEAVIGLLPRLAPPGLHRRDRQHLLSDVSGGVPNQAALAALNAGRPDRAVELVEQARGLLIAEALSASDDLSALRDLAPDLAAELIALRDHMAVIDDPGAVRGTAMELEAPEPRETLASMQQAAQARRAAAAQWDALISRIRAVPGLHDFWAPPSAESLQAAAVDGPVVILATQLNRCDALILDGPGQPVRHVPLPAATSQTAREHAARFHGAVRSAHVATAGLAAARKAQRDMRDTLEWLWDTITGPVLDALGYVAPPGPDQPWPRVCWCPVASLAHLPLHAAGYHHASDGRSALDRVVSSYTPTVQALTHLRARAVRTGSLRDPEDTLIVALPETPNATPLPGIRAEVESLRSLLPGASLLSGPAATFDAVVAALAQYPVVHFACHGVSNRREPDDSQLILYDHATRPLTIVRIMRQRLPDAGLAFLSACSTNEPMPQRTDEAVHITAGFLLAGYPRVVGTLWPIADQAASSVAARFYGNLTADGSHPPDLGSTAHALHLAVRALRTEHPGQPALWASHVLVGS